MNPSNGDSELARDNYRFLQNYIYSESGIVLDDDKHYLFEARLMPIVQQERIGSLNHLCALLRSSPSKLLKRRVVDALTTNETYFFREPAQYEALRSAVLPRLLEQRKNVRQLSFWSAASSSGQEAYSLAMMLLEMGLRNWNIRILGSDISTGMLDRARAGRYLQIEVDRGLPPAYLFRYFTRCGAEWQINDDVRRMAFFEAFDLRQDMRSLGPFDIVFCRNVLIYFDAETKTKILRQIRSTIFREGYLMLGASESIFNLNHLFARVVIGNAALYQVS